MTANRAPSVKYSRTYREWTAWNDDVRVVAAGETKKEAIANYETALAAHDEYVAEKQTRRTPSS